MRVSKWLVVDIVAVLIGLAIGRLIYGNGDAPKSQTTEVSECYVSAEDGASSGQLLFLSCEMDLPEEIPVSPETALYVSVRLDRLLSDIDELRQAIALLASSQIQLCEVVQFTIAREGQIREVTEAILEGRNTLTLLHDDLGSAGLRRENPRKAEIMQNFGDERMLLYSPKQAELVVPAAHVLAATGKEVEATEITDENGNTHGRWDDYRVVCPFSAVLQDPRRMGGTREGYLD